MDILDLFYEVHAVQGHLNNFDYILVQNFRPEVAFECASRAGGGSGVLADVVMDFRVVTGAILLSRPVYGAVHRGTALRAPDDPGLDVDILRPVMLQMLSSDRLPLGLSLLEQFLGDDRIVLAVVCFVLVVLDASRLVPGTLDFL